jgi:hypothetical protein
MVSSKTARGGTYEMENPADGSKTWPTHGYQGMVIRKPLELPPTVARAFVEDMKAYFAEENKKAPDDAGAFCRMNLERDQYFARIGPPKR